VRTLFLKTFTECECRNVQKVRIKVLGARECVTSKEVLTSQQNVCVCVKERRIEKERHSEKVWEYMG